MVHESNQNVDFQLDEICCPCEAQISILNLSKLVDSFDSMKQPSLQPTKINLMISLVLV